MRFSLTIAAMSALLAASLGAQPVYRCESAGKVQYSHEPCLGAKEVDTTPTQGLDKSSGASRKGNDVRNDEHNKAMSEVFRPLINETPEERKRRHHRAKLPAGVQLECSTLDSGLQRARSEQELFAARKRYRELGC